MKPTIYYYRGGLLRIFIISLHNIIASTNNLTVLSELHFNILYQRTDGTYSSIFFIEAIHRYNRRGFGETVALHNRYLRRCKQASQLRRACCASYNNGFYITAQRFAPLTKYQLIGQC